MHSVWWSSSPKVLGKLAGFVVEALASSLKHFPIKWKTAYTIKRQFMVELFPVVVGGAGTPIP